MRTEAMRSRSAIVGIVLAMTAVCGVVTQALCAQVLHIDSVDPKSVPQPFHPTSLELSKEKLQPKTRQDLLRIMDAEEAFTMRALPLGRKGLVLKANGGVSPDGDSYQQMLRENGVSAKPGAKVRVTDIHISGDRVVLELNGGPNVKHRLLQHISIGGMGGETPLAPSSPDPVGARVTLVFPHSIPEMTGQQLKLLLSPLLDFSVKSPLEAFTDTLPPLLGNAVKQHRVLVGMNREMVLYALSQPDRKLRETGPEGWDYEEWIYGKPPQDVQFIRFSGDRVTQVEIASIGKDPIIHDKDETNGYLASKWKLGERTVNEGDAPVSAQGDATQQKPPSLRLPGETIPGDQPQPVQAPKPSQPNNQMAANLFPG